MIYRDLSFLTKYNEIYHYISRNILFYQDAQAEGSGYRLPRVEIYEKQKKKAEKSRATSHRDDKSRHEKRRDEMIIRQGRQLKALYEIEKANFQRLEAIERQLKHEGEKKIDLSKKVLGII